MLLQLHQEDAEGASSLVAQREFDRHTMTTEYQAWLKEMAEKHELPLGSKWVVHEESSRSFFWQRPRDF